MGTLKKVKCPLCKRPLTIEDRESEGVRVLLTGSTPPAVCCQKFATADHVRVGVFINPGD